MAKITLSKEQTEAMVLKLQKYFSAELDQDLGQFDAEFLLDFFAKELGGHYYNQGLIDAKQVIMARLDTIEDDIYSLEQ